MKFAVIYYEDMKIHKLASSVQFSQLGHVQLFANPWTAACHASLSITNSWSLPKLMCIELVMPSSYLILCRPLLLLPSIFPSISVFSNESVLRIRWPKYWFQLQHHKLAKHTLFINSLFKVCSLSFFLFLFSLIFNFIFKLYNIVLVLPNIEMNLPQVYMCSPS